MQRLKVKKGNYGFKFEFTITDADGNPVDLTNLTVVLKIWNQTSKEISCTITDAAAGKCECTVPEGTFDEVGLYKAEIELQGMNYVEDTETFLIEVIESA